MLRATDIHRLALLEGDEDPPCWIREVDAFVRRDLWHWYRDPDRHRAIALIAEDSTGLVGACAADLVAPDAWYVPALYIEPSARRSGAGERLLGALIHELRTAAPSSSATWVSHPENAGMNALSIRHDAEITGTVPLRCHLNDEITDYRQWTLKL